MREPARARLQIENLAGKYLFPANPATDGVTGIDQWYSRGRRRRAPRVMRSPAENLDVSETQAFAVVSRVPTAVGPVRCRRAQQLDGRILDA